MPQPTQPPIIVTQPAAPSPELGNQRRMLQDIQEELRYLRRVLARRPMKLTLKQEPDSESEELEREIGESEDHTPGDETEATPLKKAAALMEYLSGLTEHLPNKEKTRFQASDLKMRMEYLRERLSGSSGIRKRIEGEQTSSQPPTQTENLQVTSGRLADTFRFLQGLSAFFPDQDVGESLDRRLGSVILQIDEDKTE